MLHLLNIHIDKYKKALFIVVGIFLALALVPATVQAIVSSNRIVLPVYVPGTMFGLVLALILFTSRKSGEGKFLSRLPVSSYEVFFVKFLTGVLFFVLFYILVVAGMEIMNGVFSLAGYDVAMSKGFSYRAVINELKSFGFNYLILTFFLCIISFMEKWMDNKAAAGLLLTLPLFLLMLLALFIKIFDLQEHLSFIFEFLKSIGVFYRDNFKLMNRLVMVGLFIASVFTFRIRKYRSF